MVITDPEWRPQDVSLLVASRVREREYGPHGFTIAEATDPANVNAFEGSEKPVVDYAEKARADAEAAYYKRWDQKDNPVNRHGHIWRVKKKAN